MEMIPLHNIVSNASSLLFQLGIIHISFRSLQTLRRLNLKPEMFIERHARGDWGDIDEVARNENALALQSNNSIASRYRLDGYTLLVITDRDRTSTTLLFPSE